MPNLRHGSKAGFEPGLTRLRVRHSTIELPRSTGDIYLCQTGWESATAWQQFCVPREGRSEAEVRRSDLVDNRNGLWMTRKLKWKVVECLRDNRMLARPGNNIPAKEKR